MSRIFGCGVTVAVASLLAPLAASAQDTAPDPALVKEGEYLATAAGCQGCHTVEPDRPYAGGYRLQTPFGTLVSPNITPDATGIGDWTRDDFEGALRRGVLKDGSPIYPAMPYTHFTKINDHDIDALYAYFRSVTPVENEVEVVDLPFPYNVRTSLNGWQALYFEEGRFQPDVNADALTNRGGYIVEALAHCGACHTPHSALGDELTDQRFQGGKIETWYAPNISTGEGSVLGKWNEDTLTEYLRGHSMNITPFGPMAEVSYDMAALSEDDVRGISRFILSRPPSESAERSDDSVQALAQMDVGAGVYKSNCKTCHSDDGKGAVGVAASLVQNGGVIADQPHNVVAVLIQGIAPKGVYGVMPSFAEKLSDAEIAAVTTYIRKSWGNDAPAVSRPAFVATMRRQVEPADAVTLAAAECANVPVEWLPGTIRADVAALAGAPLAPEKLAAVAKTYMSTAPDLEYTNRITAVQSAYCHALAQAEPDAPKPERLKAQTDFSTAMTDALNAAKGG